MNEKRKISKVSNFLSSDKYLFFNLRIELIFFDSTSTDFLLSIGEFHLQFPNYHHLIFAFKRTIKKV